MQAMRLAEAQEKPTAAKIKADRLANLRPNALQEQETPVKTESDTETTSSTRTTLRMNVLMIGTLQYWFGEDDEMTSLALGLHNKLVKEGVDPQSDEYHETIDSRMRQVFPDRFEDTEEEVVTTKAANVVLATRAQRLRKLGSPKRKWQSLRG